MSEPTGATRTVQALERKDALAAPELQEALIGTAVADLLREPQSAVRHRQVAEALEKVGQRALALTACEDALFIDPKDTATLHVAARILMFNVPGLSSEDCAARRVTHLRKIIELDPSDASAHFMVGLEELKQSPQAALANFQRALELRPDDPHALEYVGKAHQRLGSVEQAMRCYGKLLEEGKGSDLLPLTFVVEQLYRQGRKDEAYGQIQSFMTLNGSSDYRWCGPGAARVADFALILSQDLGKPEIALPVSKSEIHDQDAAAAVLPPGLREIKLEALRLGHPVEVTGAAHCQIVHFDLELPEQGRIKGSWVVDDGYCRCSLIHPKSDNSVVVVYANNTDREKRISELAVVLRELRNGDFEEVQALLQSNESVQAIEVSTGLGRRIAPAFPEIPVGFFSDRGVSLGEAMSGAPVCTLSALGEEPRGMHILIRETSPGHYEVTQRNGLAVTEGPDRYPAIQAEGLVELRAAAIRIAGG